MKIIEIAFDFGRLRSLAACFSKRAGNTSNPCSKYYYPIAITRTSKYISLHALFLSACSCAQAA